MTLPAAGVWEIRPANGTVNAGGGFNAARGGVDRSQQNAPYVVIDAATITVSVTTNVITFTGGYTVNTNDDPGNFVAITAGTNAVLEIFEITAANAGAGTWTMDRNVVSSGTQTDFTGNMGGARRGYNDNGSAPVRTLQASLVAGNTIYIKNEAWNENITLTVNGTLGGPVITHIGYNTSRNDIDPFAGVSTNNPVNNRASAAGDGWSIGSTNRQVFKNLNVTGAGDAGFSYTSAAWNVWINCKAYSNTNEGWEVGASSLGEMHLCEAASNGSGFVGGGTDIRLHNCYIHDNTAQGTSLATSRAFFDFCISETNGGNGFQFTSPNGVGILNCTSNANSGATTDGLQFTTPDTGVTVRNNIFSNNGRYGANATASACVIADHNDYFGNSTAARNNFPTGTGDLTSDPQFTNAGAGDYSIGTNLKAAGIPGIFPGGTSTGYLDIGAVQRQEAASGGGGGQRVIGG